MENSPTISKLNPSMQKLLRDSPEARNAFRDWLDDLDKADRAKSAIGTSPETPPRDSSPPAPFPGLYFGNTRAYYTADPEEYNWKWQKIEPNGIAVANRTFPSADVTMRYSYKTGTVQLVYPMKQHPLCDDAVDEFKESYDFDEEVYVVAHRLLVETFRNLKEEEFTALLKNAPEWFGKGYMKRKEDKEEEERK